MTLVTETGFDRRDAAGWWLGMRVVRVGDELVVYSPTRTSDDVFERLDALGRVSVLVAPNHFHHLALPAFRARYPEARVLAAERALPRLASQGHRGLRAIEREALPSGLVVHVSEGTRSGETFLSYVHGGEKTLLVCDAFFHVCTPVHGLMGAVLRATATTPGLQCGRTFKYLAVSDARAYRRWAEETLRAIAPERVLFSHGETLEGPDVLDRLLTALDQRFGAS